MRRDMPVPVMPKRERIFSLDLLRGLDIFLLTAIGPLVWAIHRTWGDYENPAWWQDQVAPCCLAQRAEAAASRGWSAQAVEPAVQRCGRPCLRSISVTKTWYNMRS